MDVVIKFPSEIDERSSSSIHRKTISLNSHQKVAASIPVWGSEIVFMRMELDERSSISQDISKLSHFQNIYPSILRTQHPETKCLNLNEETENL